MANQTKPAPLKQFTVIGKRAVMRRAAKSVQDLTKQMRAEGFVWQGIHEDKA
jgi:hypothetical protein